MNNMRYLILIFILSAVVLEISAQSKSNRNALTYKMLVTDYTTLDPQYRIERPERFIHPDDVNFGAEIGYSRYINSSFNLGFTYRLGSIDAYHNLIDSNDVNCISGPCNKRYFRNEFFTGIAMLGTYKFNNGYLLKEDFIASPYIQTGFASYYMFNRDGNFDIQIPLALGVNIRLNKLFSMQAQFDYNQSINELKI